MKKVDPKTLEKFAKKKEKTLREANKYEILSKF